MERVEYGTDGYPYKLSMSTGIENTEQYPVVATPYTDDDMIVKEKFFTEADTVAMLKELKHELYHALCHEIHCNEDCPCTNQTTSCLAVFRVCDANRAINKVIQQKINELKSEIKSQEREE